MADRRGAWRPGPMRLGPILIGLAVCGAQAGAAPGLGPPAIRFVDVTEQAGLAGFIGLQGSVEKDHIIEVMGGGAAFLDYDADGYLDILFVRGSTVERFLRGGHLVCALYRGDGQGRFEDVTEQAGLTRRGWGQGVAAADYDNDGRVDIFLTGYGGNTLYRNRGEGKFEEVGAEAGVAASHWSLGAAFSDIDSDGDLDLYAANYLFYPIDSAPRRDASCNYRGFRVFCGPRGLRGLRDALFLNDGAGRFTDVAAERGIDDDKLYGLGVLASDFNNDGAPEVFVANDLTANLFYQNNGDGTFEELAVLLGAAFSEDGIEEGSMGIDAADVNHDGLLDLYYTNSSFESNSLLLNNGDGSFTNVTNLAGHGQSTYLYVGWGVAFGDLDNDTREDIFVANGHLYPEADRFEMGLKYKQRWLVYQNQDGKKFVEKGLDFGLDRLEKSRGLALGDYDNDGDLDVVINNLDEPPTLLRNEGGNRNHWLLVDCLTPHGAPAVGARVEIQAGGTTQIREVRSGASYLSQHDARLHFGLGSASKVERLKVTWPGGKTILLEDLHADQIMTVPFPGE